MESQVLYVTTTVIFLHRSENNFFLNCFFLYKILSEDDVISLFSVFGGRFLLGLLREIPGVALYSQTAISVALPHQSVVSDRLVLSVQLYILDKHSSVMPQSHASLLTVVTLQRAPQYRFIKWLELVCDVGW